MKVLLLIVTLLPLSLASAAEMSLDGTWDFGVDRKYAGTAAVPGLQDDAGQMAAAPLWYRRQVTLPAGNWKNAVLILKGSRFAPATSVNGDEVGHSEGGMSAITIPLRHAAIKPGATVTLEIALQSLKKLPKADASTIPAADNWRSDVSSHFWDDVVLETDGDFRIARITPVTDFAGRKLTVRWSSDGAVPASARCELRDAEGKVVAQAEGPAAGELVLSLPATCRTWSPEDPYCHTLTLTLTGNGETESKSITYGYRELKTDGRAFVLNGHPYQLRGANTPFFRFLRDPQAAELAWNHDWWNTQIIQRLKAYGANYLRFHLGGPPEWLLDLCDRAGLIVQYEWPAFHGLPGSEDSLAAQWRPWLDTAMRHPSVMLFQLCNESKKVDEDKGWAVLNRIAADYPPLLMAHRDLVNVHHYWWSLFENLDLTYNSPADFPSAAVVDEFGGDYIDGEGNPGTYTTVKGAFQRFLGPDFTKEEALELQADACGRVAEYWRRLGVAGFAPFCTLGSPKDGNHWFLGNLKRPQLKPVWAAMRPAWSAQSVSLELWDRNFTPGQTIEVPVWFFNDTGTAVELKASVGVLEPVMVTQSVAAWSRQVVPVRITLPAKPGTYTVQARLGDVVSAWKVAVLQAQVPAALKGRRIGVAADETELREFLAARGVAVVDWAAGNADMLLASKATWTKLADKKGAERAALDAVLKAGKGVVLLDLTTVGRSGEPVLVADEVRFGFVKGEQESCVFPTAAGRPLWTGLEFRNTELWNGLRGGLIVPKDSLRVASGNAEDFLAQWKARGADETALRGGPYYAYELAGRYAFSAQTKDKAVQQELRKKVKFLLDDAPALAGQIDPAARINEFDLGAAFRQLGQSRQEAVPLAVCGQGLTQNPVWLVNGRVMLSTLLTAGRLGRSPGKSGLYDVRHDEAACQMVLNMMSLVLGGDRPATK